MPDSTRRMHFMILSLKLYQNRTDGVRNDGRSLGRGKLEPETTAFAGFGFDPHVSPHSLGGFLDNGKADARAGISFVSIETFEEAENPIAVLGLDADAIVLDANAHGIVSPLGPKPNVRVGLGRNKL